MSQIVSPLLPIEEVIGAVRDALSALLTNGTLQSLDPDCGHSLVLTVPSGRFYFDVRFGPVQRNPFGLRVRSEWFAERDGRLVVTPNNMSALQFAAQEAIKAQTAQSGGRSRV